MSWLLEGEPPLEADEIQGHVLVGFGAAPQALGAFTAHDLAAAARTVGRWSGRVNSTSDLMERRGHKTRDYIKAAGPWVTLSVSCRLLSAAGAPVSFDDGWLTSEEGMAGLTILNDPKPEEGGQLGSDWVVGSPGKPIDVLIVVAAGRTEAAEEIVSWFAEDAAGWCEAAFPEPLCPLRGSIEHFGFKDGVSQPAILGTVGGEPFEANRMPDQGPVPYARPGQELVWPGSFVFGYPARDRFDPRLPGETAIPTDPSTARFARNGSLLVYRRLCQNVAAFRAACEELASDLATDRYPGLTGERLQALIVGRWPNGIPIARGPATEPATDEALLNAFTFLDDDMADGCPLSAHIRKVNPRLGGSDLDNVVPRILRRGAPFGPEYSEGETPPRGGRGLAFLYYQTSIEGQFGALTTKWMNSPSAPNGGGGHDVLVGQVAAGASRTFEVKCPDRSECPIDVGAGRWVRMTGGGLLVTPSLSALRSLLTPDQEEANHA